jgi:hypothetical protein
MEFLGQVPARLWDAVKDGNCLLFVGAGLSSAVRRSTGVGLPSWPGLLAELLEFSEEEGIRNPDSAAIRSLIEAGNLLEAGQEIRDLLGHDLQRAFLKIFGDTALRPSDTHYDLTGLPFAGILTTNYDALLEGACTLRFGGREPLSFTQAEFDATAPSPLRSRTFFVLKAHGDYRKVSTVILGTRDYQELLYSAVGYRHFLEQAFSSYTILFLGYGGVDPDFDEVLNKIAFLGGNGFDPHFLLLPAGRISELLRNALRRDRRLQIIEYEPSEDHSQVSAFVQSLLGKHLFPAGFGKLCAKRVLISHKSEHKPIANQLADALDFDGLRYSLYDSSSFVNGLDYLDIDSRVRLATVLISIHEADEEAALDVPFILAEKHRRHIVPVVLGLGPAPEICRRYPYFSWPDPERCPDLAEFLEYLRNCDWEDSEIHQR